MSDIRYKRVLLKLSGEALMGDGQYGIDPKVTDHLAKQVKELLAVGHEVASLSAAAYFPRHGSAAGGMERAQADYMGMLATVMTRSPCRMPSSTTMFPAA